MSTRCRIAIKDEKGIIRSVYCHGNGEPELVGQVLVKYYGVRTRVESLIKLGDLSVVRKKLRPNKSIPHDFYHPQRDVTIAYHRDRGGAEDVLRIATHKNAIDYVVKTGGDIDYFYLFNVKTNQWYFYANQKNIQFRPLTPIVQRIIEQEKARKKTLPKLPKGGSYNNLPF